MSAFENTDCIQYCIIPYMQDHVTAFLCVPQSTTSCIRTVLFISYAQHFL